MFKKLIAKTNMEKLFLYVFSGVLEFHRITFKSSIHFELIFVSGVRWGPVSFSFRSFFLCMCDYPVFPALLRRLFLPIECSWLQFQMLVSHIA